MTQALASQPLRLLFGCALIVAGLLLLADRLGWIDVDLRPLWPLIPLAVGLTLVAGARTAERRRGGLLVTAVGLWLVLSELRPLGFDYGSSWPLLLLLLGVVLLVYPSEGSRAPGVVLTLLGLIFLAAETDLLGFSLRDAWPLALVAAGIVIVTRTLAAQRRLRDERRRARGGTSGT